MHYGFIDSFTAVEKTSMMNDDMLLRAALSTYPVAQPVASAAASIASNNTRRHPVMADSFHSPVIIG